jgi:hypothetical protein
LFSGPPVSSRSFTTVRSAVPAFTAGRGFIDGVDVLVFFKEV